MVTALHVPVAGALEEEHFAMNTVDRVQLRALSVTDQPTCHCWGDIFMTRVSRVMPALFTCSCVHRKHGSA